MLRNLIFCEEAAKIKRKKRNTMNKQISCYQWTGPAQMANFHYEVNMPNGARSYETIGQIMIEPGDLITIDYGRSVPVYTQSGRGFESEFIYGRANVCGVSANVELTEQTSKCVKPFSTSKEQFDEMVKNQQSRITPVADLLLGVFIHDRLEDQQSKDAADERKKEKTKDMIKDALSLMEGRFPKKPKF